VTYDTSAVAYEELLTVFWDLIDPTTLNRQGGDAGTQYRTGIYYHDDHQRLAAQRYAAACALVFVQ
jgi:peptide-methionine (S)-S-oxide reductase